MPAAVLFDLDGCLADSRRTILDGMNHALTTHGIPARTDAELEGYIGPPTRVAFGDILHADPDSRVVDAVVGTYRKRYETDLERTPTFDGIPEALDALKAAGIHLAVATSKPMHFAVPVLAALGLQDRFDAVAGPQLTGTAGKAETMGEAIAALGPDVTPVAMVGDRRHDIEGAQAHSLFSVGVLWGIGSREELEAAGADVLVDAPAQLVGVLTDAVSAFEARRASSSEQTGP